MLSYKYSIVSKIFTINMLVCLPSFQTLYQDIQCLAVGHVLSFCTQSLIPETEKQIKKSTLLDPLKELNKINELNITFNTRFQNFSSLIFTLDPNT